MKQVPSPKSDRWSRTAALSRQTLLAAALLLTGGLLHAGEPTATSPMAATAEFPSELVDFVPFEHNPVFTAAGPGHWDVKIRERGWILHEGDQYRLWFTGYDGTRLGARCWAMRLRPMASTGNGRPTIHWTAIIGSRT